MNSAYDKYIVHVQIDSEILNDICLE